MSELDFVRSIVAGFRPHQRVSVGPGDDAAVYGIGEQHSALMITSDMLMEGVHFERSTTRPEEIGRKALAVNLSDIAAMAGEPQVAVVSLAIPRSMELVEVQRLSSGISELAAAFDTPIVGGDTNCWDGPLVISITVVARISQGHAVLRQGAQLGDLVLLTGSLGGSLPSGKHLNFTPRIQEALWLHSHYDLHAMMDVSDGLATDLRRLAAASHCAAVLDPAAIPLSPILAGNPDALQHALCDGEDFELLFTMRPADAERLLAEQPFGHCPIALIGEIAAGEGLFWRSHGKAPCEEIRWRAYEHRFGSPPDQSKL